MADNETGAAALHYAEAHGIPVFPLWPGKKEPMTPHGFKDSSTDPSTIARWWQRTPAANVGGEMGCGIVCLDFDRDDDEGYDSRDWLAAWELEHGKLPETACAVTGRGGAHYFYRVDRPVPKSENKDLHIDIRGDGSYVMMAPSVHPNGNTVYWDLDPDEYGIAEADENVYALIEAVRPAPTKVDGEFGREDAGVKIVGTGRNTHLFKLASSMQAQSFPDAAIMAAVKEVNLANCEPPLPDREVEKTVRGVCDRYEKGLSDEAVEMQKTALGAAEAPSDGTPAKQAPQGHVAIAEALMRDHRACFIDGMPAVRVGSIYRTGWQAVNAAMVEIKRSIKSAQRREVREYLTIAAPRVEQSRWTLVGFENGVLDIETTEFRDYTDDDVICNVIPHRWNPAAECPEVDALLDRVSCGDQANRDNIEETAALCALRTARFGTCPVFVGDGANGKSTVLTMIRGLVGMDNISALQPREVNARFQGARLVGKTANLGDDISSEFLTADECAGIKKVATGDLIYSDVKSAEGIEFVPYATMVFSANEFPRLGDSTPGMYRRLHPIEFNARFTRDDPDYDPNIVDKVTSEEAMERLAVLAMLAVGRLRDNRGMTPNAASERILDAIQEDNNTVLMWARMTDTAEAGVIGRAAADVYRDYKEWCFDSNAKPLGVKKFNKALRTLWHVEPGDPEHATYHGRQTTVRHYRKAGA